MARISQSESALNKISVFTPTIEKQATKEHDNVSLHALLMYLNKKWSMKKL